jgi:hypothetical protein
MLTTLQGFGFLGLPAPISAIAYYNKALLRAMRGHPGHPTTCHNGCGLLTSSRLIR